MSLATSQFLLFRQSQSVFKTVNNITNNVNNISNQINNVSTIIYNDYDPNYDEPVLVKKNGQLSIIDGHTKEQIRNFLKNPQIKEKSTNTINLC